MGYVTKTVTENVGDVTKTTSYVFESSEDFLRWEGGQVSNQEEKVGIEVGRRYRVIGKVTGHGFEIGEVVEVISYVEGGSVHVNNGVEEWWIREVELEEI